MRKSLEQTPCARGSAASAVPLTEPVQVMGMGPMVTKR
jgi:hypothetical protein